MGCLKYAFERIRRCTQTRDDGYNKCTETRDEGYNACTQTRDDGYRKCCTWWPCSWFCRAWVWISHIVCVVWTWISNIVCVAWTWVKNIVCVAWVIFTTIICVVFDAIIKVFTAIPLVNLLVKAILNALCGNKKPPRITTPHEAKDQLTKQLRDNGGQSPYKKLSGFDKWIAWLTTPVFKENGICGWTDYHLVACASGRVQQAVLSADGIYTVDIELDSDGGSFTVENGVGQFEDGIDKPNYMRAEILANVVAATHDLPREKERVTICGALFWDGDGFLEIHPRRAEDIHILQHD